MKSRFFATAWLALFLFCFSSTAQTTVTRTLSPFDKISISGGFDKVVLKEGNAESVTLVVSGIDPDNIKTEVQNSTLRIATKKGSYSNFKATITVTYKSIHKVVNSGSTHVVAESVIKGDEFEFASSGSGDFTGTLDVRELEIAISGSSKMNLKGRADEQEIAISGSGKVNASELKGSKAEVSISGSGNVQLNVDGPVKTAVSGSGKVTNN